MCVPSQESQRSWICVFSLGFSGFSIRLSNMCVKGIEFTPLSLIFSIRLWNCFDGEIFWIISLTRKNIWWIHLLYLHYNIISLTRENNWWIHLLYLHYNIISLTRENNWWMHLLYLHYNIISLTREYIWWIHLLYLHYNIQSISK